MSHFEDLQKILVEGILSVNEKELLLQLLKVIIQEIQDCTARRDWLALHELSIVLIPNLVEELKKRLA